MGWEEFTYVFSYVFSALYIIKMNQNKHKNEKTKKEKTKNKAKTRRECTQTRVVWIVYEVDIGSSEEDFSQIRCVQKKKGGGGEWREIYSKVLRYDEGYHLWGIAIWMFRVDLWNSESSSTTLFHTDSASLFILISRYSSFSSACRILRGQIRGHFSFMIHLMELFCTTCNLFIWVFEHMLRGTTGYVNRGSISALYSLAFSLVFKYLNLRSFFCSLLARFTI